MTEQVFSAKMTPAIRAITWGGCGAGALAASVAMVKATGGDRTALLITIPVLLLTALGIDWVFSSVQLHVLPGEVRIDYGRSRIRTRIRHDQIVSVDVIDIRGWKWGYGYRFSRKLFRKAGIVVRSGEALRLHLTDGSTLAVTVDGADDAAMAVRAAVGGS